MKKLFCFLIPVSLFQQAEAQQKIPAIKWDSIPKIHSVPSEYSRESAVILEETVRLETIEQKTIEKKIEKTEFFVYRTEHKITKVLDEKGIEIFNKLTIPLGKGKKMKSLRARTILPDGKVIEIPKEKINTRKGDLGTEYYIAMEGVEKDAEIEVLYTQKIPISLWGYEMMQYSFPVLNSTYELYTPERFKYELKGYNGYPKTRDSLLMWDGMRYYYVKMSPIPALHKESYSNYDAFRMRVDYKLTNMVELFDRLVTWKDLARYYYKAFYSYNEREAKAVERYLSKIEVNKSDSDIVKIRKIEDAIKNDIFINNELTENSYEQLDRILDGKNTTENGCVKLFAACLDKMNVKHEIGICTDKAESAFDESFESLSHMETYLIYFPGTGKYLAPNYKYLRYPFIPSGALGNKAIFCKPPDHDEGEIFARDVIREVAPLPGSQSQDNIEATVTFETDALEPKIDIIHTFSGHTAVGLRESIVLKEKDKEKETVQEIVDIAEKPEDLVSYKISNSGFHNYYENKPLKINATVKAPQLMEKAGPKYLFKVGEVIGKQSELYQTDTRVLPIDLPYPHEMNRTIIVNIPQGYKVLNPEKIRIAAEFKNSDGKATMGFKSDYKEEGNKLTVTVNEFYTQLHAPVSDYEAFRKIINAAADFNKVMLVLVKR